MSITKPQTHYTYHQLYSLIVHRLGDNYSTYRWATKSINERLIELEKWSLFGPQSNHLHGIFWNTQIGHSSARIFILNVMSESLHQRCNCMGSILAYLQQSCYSKFLQELRLDLHLILARLEPWKNLDSTYTLAFLSNGLWVFKHCLILTCLVRVLIQLLPEEPAHDQDCI